MLKVVPDLNKIARPNWIEINLDALCENVAFIRSQIPVGTKILLPVKADAYGHGSLACSFAAKECGVDFLGVAHINEGILLRQYGIDLPILVLGPCTPADFDVAMSTPLFGGSSRFLNTGWNCFPKRPTTGPSAGQGSLPLFFENSSASL